MFIMFIVNYGYAQYIWRMPTIHLLHDIDPPLYKWGFAHPLFLNFLSPALADTTLFKDYFCQLLWCRLCGRYTVAGFNSPADPRDFLIRTKIIRKKVKSSKGFCLISHRIVHCTRTLHHKPF